MSLSPQCDCMCGKCMEAISGVDNYWPGHLAVSGAILSEKTSLWEFEPNESLGSTLWKHNLFGVDQ